MEPLIKSNPLKWLQQNYERHNVTTMARMLNVTVLDVEKLLLQIGVDLELSPEDQQFIRRYYGDRMLSEIVHELSTGRPDNLLRTKVLHFIKKNGITKSDYNVPKIPVVRAAPDHTNVNHADRVAKWANMSIKEIKSHKGRINY
jgi:hypothetical protein